jgi:putative ABC transport system permease protein
MTPWIAPSQFRTLLMALFGMVALVLAGVGLYGVMSYDITQRTHEIGIRFALGATPRDVLTLMVGRGLRLVLIGLGIGMAGALALARLLSSLLFNVSTVDPLTFTVIATVLTLVALLACWIPSRRATKVDPMVTLRHE